MTWSKKAEPPAVNTSGVSGAKARTCRNAFAARSISAAMFFAVTAASDVATAPSYVATPASVSLAGCAPMASRMAATAASSRAPARPPPISTRTSAGRPACSAAAASDRTVSGESANISMRASG
ncbi:hypothetical protein D3C71_1469000 [compost metagenome]